MQIGAVADDFTGATDLATTLRLRGLRTAVVIEDREVAAEKIDGLDAVIVALKTRTAPVEEAVADSLAALDRVLEWGAERVYFKYCSTFDSTDRGNIGPVLDAFLSRLDVDRTVIVPSFPANGRTVENGLLFVDGELLERSSMRHHPLTPMTRSRLRDILSPQTGQPISEIPLSVVRSGVAEVRGAIASAPAGYLVVDAVDDDDLRTIAEASDSLRLLSGAAGLALGLASTAHPDADAALPSFSGRRLVVCGSASATTRAQIADAAARHPARRVDVTAAIADPAREMRELAAWVHALADDTVPIVYSVGELADVRPGDAGAEAAEAIEAVLSGLVALLIRDGSVDRVIVAGGETSGAVVKALGISMLLIGPQLAPGVCWSVAETSDGHEVALVLKSGNFGAVDLFSSAWELLV